MRLKHLKRLLSAALIAGVLATSVPVMTSNVYADSYEYTIGNSKLLYTINNNEITITGYQGSANTLVIPEEIDGKKVTVIGDFAFYGCTELTDITIPESVRFIYTHAIKCINLERISVDEKNSAFMSKDGVLFNKQMTALLCYPAKKTEVSYSVPNSVTCIGSGAFYKCASLKDITIPESVRTIDDQIAFQGCINLEEINVDNDNSEFMSKDGVLFDKQMTALICYPAKKTGVSYSIPNSVTSIRSQAFDECEELTNIVIPESVNYIAYIQSFYKCKNLTSISVDENNMNYTSENGVLFSKNMESLLCYPTKKTGTSYTVPESVTYIYPDAFAGCIELTNITLPESVNNIDVAAFSDCIDLTNVTILGTNVSIDDDAFWGVPNLTIYGYADSSAESYANEHNINFRIIGETLSGDIDGDGTINSTDAVAIQKYLAGNVIEGFTKESADLNGDGEVDSADSVLLMKYLAGYEVKFGN